MAVKEGELAQLAGLKAEWQGYRKLLSDVGVRLQKVDEDDFVASVAIVDREDEVEEAEEEEGEDAEDAESKAE